MTIHPCHVGCDVSKAHLDFFDPEHPGVVRIANEEAAIGSYLDGLAERPVFVVYEATGTYDRALAHGLAARGLPSHRINPIQAKRFAQATGRRAKTDPLDAAMLADLGARLTPPPDPAPCKQRERLCALHKRRDQLVDQRKRERTRAKEAMDTAVARSIQTIIHVLTEEITAIEAVMNDLIAKDDTLRRKREILHSAPGVGAVTAATVLALMPELGAVNPKQIASLAGLAPFNHDSGAMRGRRCIAGGRRRVRHALYMAALTACRAEGRYKTFYDKLCAKNPAKKIAIIAVARKLITHLNAMIRDDKPFA